MQKTLQTNFAERVLRGLMPEAAKPETASDGNSPTQKETTGNGTDVQTPTYRSAAPDIANGNPSKAAV